VENASGAGRGGRTVRGMTDDLDGTPAGDQAGSRPVRRTTLPTTSQRLAQLGRDLEDLDRATDLPAAELLGRCWPAVLSVAAVETVLVDEGLRDAPGPVVRRHRQATRGHQAELLQALVDALGADQVDQRRGDALLLGDERETSADEAGMHLGWWLGDDGPSLQAAIELKKQLRGPLRAVVADPAGGDAVRLAAALAEVALHLAPADR
jgi:hypothetical protein